jgi:hypothetical protein
MEQENDQDIQAVVGIVHVTMNQSLDMPWVDVCS